MSCSSWNETMNSKENALVSDWVGWTLRSLEECPSTNDAARDLLPWEAVVARRQSAGRGRLGRSWQSGFGGAWISAVVPAPISKPTSKLIPLAAGYAVSLSMMEFGVSNVRLRWPNDVMINSRKCAGILVDRFHPDRCVVGMGINVFNDPSAEDSRLKGQTTRLKELISPCPLVHDVIAHVLANLRQIMTVVDHDGAAGLIRRLQPLWKIPSRVAVKSADGENEYDFFGVDDEGRVQLKSTSGSVQKYAPEEIEMLREI